MKGNVQLRLATCFQIAILLNFMLRCILLSSSPYINVLAPLSMHMPAPALMYRRLPTTKWQMRGVWLTTVSNIDWPSRPGLSIGAQKHEFLQLLDFVQNMHLNTIVVQIRPMADAFYPSRYTPWSQYLTGTQGKDPHYDPLAFMLAEAHKRNLAFHAWFNPYRVSTQDDVNRLAVDNPARLHPDWVVHYGDKLYYNPGIPAVRAYIIASILEVVRNYAIDAVHLDDYFYPYPVARQDFPDEATYLRYGAAQFSNKAAWRRSTINQFVQDLYKSIKQVKPEMQFGISPGGVWRNKAVDLTGSDTRAGLTDYDNLYADTRTWIKQHWIDYIAPQIYWSIGFAPAPYETLVAWWSREVEGSHVQLYIGQAAYKVAKDHQNPAAWSDANELLRQLELNQRYPQIQGSIFFSLKYLVQNPLRISNRLCEEFYR